jgi:hypothetical protein
MRGRSPSTNLEAIRRTKPAKPILVGQDRPVEGAILRLSQTLTLSGKYRIQQLVFIAEMLGRMFTLPIDSCSIAISRHISATLRHIPRGLMANSEALHQ